MSTIKPKRTLGPAQFEAFMGFADSLKDGTNNDAINKFKYNMAVREGYIKPQLEAAGGFTAENLKQGINGLLQVFMPLLDSGEQAIVGGVMEEFDKAVAAGKNPAEVFFGNGGDDEESADETEVVVVEPEVGCAPECAEGECDDCECTTVCDGDKCETVCEKECECKGSEEEEEDEKPADKPKPPFPKKDGKKDSKKSDDEKEDEKEDEKDSKKPNSDTPIEECGEKNLQESIGDDGVDYDALADMVLQNAVPAN